MSNAERFNIELERISANFIIGKDEPRVVRLTKKEKRLCKEFFENVITCKLDKNALYKDSPHFKVSEITKEDLELMLKFCRDGHLTSRHLKKSAARMLSLFASLEIFDDVNAITFTETDSTKVGDVSQLKVNSSPFIQTVPLVYPLFNEGGLDEFHRSLPKYLIDANKAIYEYISTLKYQGDAMNLYIEFMLTQMIELIEWKETQQDTYETKIVHNEGDSNASLPYKGVHEMLHVTSPLDDLHEIVLSTINYVFDKRHSESSKILEHIGGFKARKFQFDEIYQSYPFGSNNADIIQIQELNSNQKFFLYESNCSLKSLGKTIFPKSVFSNS